MVSTCSPLLILLFYVLQLRSLLNNNAFGDHQALIWRALATIHFLFRMARMVQRDNQEDDLGISEDDLREYEVECVLNHEYYQGKHYYLLKFAGYTLDQAYWTAEADCDCQELVQDYWDSEIQ